MLVQHRPPHGCAATRRAGSTGVAAHQPDAAAAHAASEILKPGIDTTQLVRPAASPAHRPRRPAARCKCPAQRARSRGPASRRTCDPLPGRGHGCRRMRPRARTHASRIRSPLRPRSRRCGNGGTRLLGGADDPLEYDRSGGPLRLGPSVAHQRTSAAHRAGSCAVDLPRPGRADRAGHPLPATLARLRSPRSGRPRTVRRRRHRGRIDAHVPTATRHHRSVTGRDLDLQGWVSSHGTSGWNVSATGLRFGHGRPAHRPTGPPALSAQSA